MGQKPMTAHIIKMICAHLKQTGHKPFRVIMGPISYHSLYEEMKPIFVRTRDIQWGDEYDLHLAGVPIETKEDCPTGTIYIV